MPRPYNAHLVFRRFGDWAGVIAAFSVLDKNIKNSARYGQRKAAEELVRRVKQHIQDQDLGWLPLSISTIYRKGHSRALQNTMLYYSSIKVWEQGNTVNAGVPRGIQYKDGTEVATVGVINEFGGGNVPARPLWGPTIQEMGGKDGIRERVAAVLAKRINRSLAGKPFKVSSRLLMTKY